MSSLILRDLSFSFEGSASTLFDNLSLEARLGNIVGLVGSSGIGKSTVLRLVAGVERPTNGTITLPRTERLRLPVALHLQDPALIPWRTVGQNLMLGVEFAENGLSCAYDQITQVLALDELQDRYPAFLSGGQAERTALGRTLLTNATVFLLDEPLGGTDYERKLAIEEFLVDFVKDDRLIVIVTHDLPQALALSSKIIVLKKNDSLIATHEVSLPEDFSRLRPSIRRQSPQLGPLVRLLSEQMGRSLSERDGR